MDKSKLLDRVGATGDDRLVLVARRLRDGESEAYALQQLR